MYGVWPVVGGKIGHRGKMKIEFQMTKWIPHPFGCAQGKLVRNDKAGSVSENGILLKMTPASGRG
jgi:hypothetical protein